MKNLNGIEFDTWMPLVPERIAPFSKEDEKIILTVKNKPGKISQLLFRGALKKHPTKYLHLDELGGTVWEACNKSNTIAQIIKQLQAKYPEEKGIDHRVIMFIDQLVKQGAIQLLERIDND